MTTTNVKAVKTQSDAFDFWYPYASNSTWINLATQPDHKNAFQHAANHFNQINGIYLSSVGQINFAKIITRTNTDNVTWWGQKSGNPGYQTIEINYDRTRLDQFSRSNYRWLALHEFGHALGLSHQTNRNAASVMRQQTADKKPYAMTDLGATDKSNLRWRYSE